MSTKLFLIGNLTPERKNLLAQSGIPFSEWHDYGVLIEGQQTLTLLLEALNAEVVRKHSAYGGITRVHLRFPLRRVRRARSPASRAVRQRNAREQARQRYIAACSSRLAEMMANVQRVTVPTLSELVTAEKQLVELSRKRRFTQEMPENLEAAFADELDQILNVDKVRELELVPNGVLVRTETLCASVSDTKSYEIGEFAILIKFAGDGTGVYWFNQTRLIDGSKPRMNSPKVFNNGMAANDDLKPILLEHIGRCELALVVDLAIQFIETIDPADPLCQMIERWPRAGTATAVQNTRQPFRLRVLTSYVKTAAQKLVRRFRRTG